MQDALRASAHPMGLTINRYKKGHKYMALQT